MPATVSVFGVLFAIGMLFITLFPAIVPWWIGKNLPARRRFVVVCCLLAYGCSTVASVLFLPVEFVATELAPQWEADGVHWPMIVLGWISRVSLYLSLSVGVVTAFWIPLRLRVRWPNIVIAMNGETAAG